MTVTQRINTTRASLAAAALVGAALVFLAVLSLHPPLGVALPSLAFAGALWLCRGVFSRSSVVLWLETRMPELRYSLVALAEDPQSQFRAALEARVLSMDPGRVVTMAMLRLVGVPFVLLLVTQFVVRPLLDRVALPGGAASAGLRGGRAAIGGGRRDYEAVVTAPAYARIATEKFKNPTAIAGLVGSEVQFSGAFDDRRTMPRKPAVISLVRDGTEQLVTLEPRPDSSPHVVLSLPARDTVLPRAGGVLSLTASARDDYGLVSGWFEMIVSSGDGESFMFRNAVIARTAAHNGRDLQLNATLRLDTLDLKPGDIVHLRAVARDANPASDAEAGSSETRTLRVYRRGESDSVEIEAMAPPETGKSELSQRMLIMLTEKLVAQTRTLAKPAFGTESRNIAVEQARLRKRVGQIIFTRLTGEEDADDAAGALADTLSPMEALLRAADSATGAAAGEHLEEGEDAPVVAVNRPLLEAFNSMWEAERQLGVIEPRKALPHMKAALAAIQRARAAERLYLRGRPPKIVLDLARIRLSGKKDGINPGERSPRASAVSVQLARQSRFSAAIGLLSRDSAAAAIDSLTLLRVEALSDQPALASALATAVNELRSGRDATASLRAARRALVGAPRDGAASRWSGQ
jgi:hypothetical protein